MTLKAAVEQLGNVCQWDPMGPKDMDALELVLEALEVAADWAHYYEQETLHPELGDPEEVALWEAFVEE